MVDLAIAAIPIKGPYSVPRDHQMASSVFVEFATGLMKKNGIETSTSNLEASLADKFTFAAAQFDNPVTRNANEMRRTWAEVKNPQMRIDRELAENKAVEKRKADEKAAITASLETNRKASEERSRQRSQNANEGRNSRMPSGLQDSLRNGRAGRGGMS